MKLPNDYETIREMRQHNPTTLKIFIGGSIQANCHFFCEEEIELDIDPNDINTESEYLMLVAFLEWLSQKLQKKVIVTYENIKEAQILSISR